MEMASPREVIIDIKEMIDQHKLSVPDILKMLEEEGLFPSETTVRRLVKKGSEDNDSFNFEQTIKPIADVFYKRFKAADKTAQAQIDLYKHISEYKLEVIDLLHKQIEHMKDEQLIRCQKCEQRLADMQKQIEIKDRRMDEQAQRLDKLIDKLLEKV